MTVNNFFTYIIHKIKSLSEIVIISADRFTTKLIFLITILLVLHFNILAFILIKNNTSTAAVMKGKAKVQLHIFHLITHIVYKPQAWSVSEWVTVSAVSLDVQ